MTSPAQKTSVKELKASRAFKLLHAKDVLDLLPPTQAEIEEFEARVTGLNQGASFAYAVGVLLALFAMLGLVSGLVVIALASFWDGAVLMLFSTLAFLAGNLLMSHYKDVPSIKNHTGKLASREACERALLLTERYAQANSYREAVLDQGRELRMLDLALIEAICKEAEIQKETELTKERCQKLHGIAA